MTLNSPFPFFDSLRLVHRSRSECPRSNSVLDDCKSSYSELLQDRISAARMKFGMVTLQGRRCNGAGRGEGRQRTGGRPCPGRRRVLGRPSPGRRVVVAARQSTRSVAAALRAAAVQRRQRQDTSGGERRQVGGEEAGQGARTQGRPDARRHYR